MQLDELDRRLLEVLALRVPWYMVCGEFHADYGGPEPLARRLVELEHAGLVEIRDTTDASALVTAEVLVTDAMANDCYEELEDTREPRWDVVATNDGFRIIESRLGRQ